jgi:hypothetical protein
MPPDPESPSLKYLERIVAAVSRYRAGGGLFPLFPLLLAHALGGGVRVPQGGRL